MGVHDYLLTSAVTAIQAQRLVRKLCDNCKEAYTPLNKIVRRWGLDKLSADGNVTLYHSKGCDQCGQTGFAGRTAILEILPISDAIKEQVLNNADATSIRRCAEEGGMETMIEDGLRKSLSGITTMGEVLRVAPEFAE